MLLPRICLTMVAVAVADTTTPVAVATTAEAAIKHLFVHIGIAAA